MDTIQSIEKYFYLYFKSLAFVWKASRVNMLLMLLTVPLQALLPSLTILMTNEIINSLSFSKENNITSLLDFLRIFVETYRNKH